MTIHSHETDNHLVDAEPIGHTYRGRYTAHHPAEAARLISADPGRFHPGETVRLANTRVIATVAGQPEPVRIPGETNTWTSRVPVRAASPFEIVIHGQIEVIEKSLRDAAHGREQTG